MPVIQCECGKSLKVRDSLIGKRIKCPTCGATQVVEAPGAASLTVEVTSKRRKESEVDQEVVERPRKKKKKAKSTDNKKPIWLVGGGAAALVGVALVGAFLVYMFSNSGDENNSVSGTKPSSAQTTTGKLHAMEPAVTGDGRDVFYLSNDGFTIKGSSVRIERVKLAELQIIVGPPDDIVVQKLSLYDIALWHEQGFRAGYSRNSSVVTYLDIFFSAGDRDEEPKEPFGGMLKVEGVVVSGATSKKLLEESGKITQAPFNHTIGQGFSIFYRDHDISFTPSNGALDHVRISGRPSR